MRERECVCVCMCVCVCVCENVRHTCRWRRCVRSDWCILPFTVCKRIQPHPYHFELQPPLIHFLRIKVDTWKVQKRPSHEIPQVEWRLKRLMHVPREIEKVTHEIGRTYCRVTCAHFTQQHNTHTHTHTRTRTHTHTHTSKHKTLASKTTATFKNWDERATQPLTHPCDLHSHRLLLQEQPQLIAITSMRQWHLCQDLHPKSNQINIIYTQTQTQTHIKYVYKYTTKKNTRTTSSGVGNTGGSGVASTTITSTASGAVASAAG